MTKLFSDHQLTKQMKDDLTSFFFTTKVFFREINITKLSEQDLRLFCGYMTQIINDGINREITRKEQKRLRLFEMSDLQLLDYLYIKYGNDLSNLTMEELERLTEINDQDVMEE